MISVNACVRACVVCTLVFVWPAGQVIFKDGVEGDEMCGHFRQMSKCHECAAGVPPTKYAEY